MKRHRTRNRIVFAVTFAVIFALVNLGLLYSRVYADWRARFLMDVDLKAYRLSHPAPYADSPYWSEAFVLEYDHMNAHMNQYGYFEYDDYHGTWYNFDNGLRRTVGQPTRYAHTVWLFGNSGLADPYVPDAYTAASQLQAMLPSVRVMNKAMGGMHINAEYLSLQHTALRPGDVVIFVDGGMDEQDATPLARYWQTVNSAHDYAIARGVSFAHFVQACYMPVDLQPRIDMPQSMFVDHGCHMNEHGDAIVARALYDAITTF